MRELSEEFFKEDTVKVAKLLVGKILCVDGVKARILEVEAYKQDRASHAFKKTPRSEIMFKTYGHVYVYFIYGMYYCLNFTTDSKPGAVLIRALDLDGCDGPGRLCKKLNITTKDNGVVIGGRFRIFDDGYKPKITACERIGISQDKHLKWRFKEKK
ncbi:MAG: DNA-3-methyladenine glycosylase [Candidatus Woesearchaeota archaeon]